MYTLTSQYNNRLEYKGKTYQIDDAYDNILLMFEMFEDDTFLDFEKVGIAVEMLMGEIPEEIESDAQLYELFKYLMKEFVDVDVDNQDAQNEKKIFDFKQDAELIYASFFSAYGIDLEEQKGKMPWVKFIRLLRQLDDKTPFKKAIGYRVMKIPKETKYNREQVRELRRLKQAFALKDDAQTDQKTQDDKLNAAFSALARKGVKKNGG